MIDVGVTACKFAFIRWQNQAINQANQANPGKNTIIHAAGRGLLFAAGGHRGKTAGAAPAAESGPDGQSGTMECWVRWDEVTVQKLAVCRVRSRRPGTRIFQIMVDVILWPLMAINGKLTADRTPVDS